MNFNFFCFVMSIGQFFIEQREKNKITIVLMNIDSERVENKNVKKKKNI